MGRLDLEKTNCVMASPTTIVRTQQPWTHYTHEPLARAEAEAVDTPSPKAQLSRAEIAAEKRVRSARRHADARLRHSLRVAWCEPETARRDVLAASAIYANLRDAGGMASACLAHADLRRAAALSAAKQCGTPDRPPPALTTGLARAEYVHAASLFGAMLGSAPVSFDTHYDWQRHKSFRDAHTAQQHRPFPLTFTALDANVAALGGSERAWQLSRRRGGE